MSAPAGNEPGAPGAPAHDPKDARGTRCIAVHVAGALYGLWVEEVEEVIAMRPLTRVFHAPAAIAGVMSLRGDVLPVLELGVLLGASPALASEQARIVVVREPGGPRRRAGVHVDELRGLRSVGPEGLLPLPATAAEAVRELVAGVIPSAPPCSVLSVPAILGSRQIAAFAAETGV